MEIWGKNSKFSLFWPFLGQFGAKIHFFSKKIKSDFIIIINTSFSEKISQKGQCNLKITLINRKNCAKISSQGTKICLC